MFAAASAAVVDDQRTRIGFTLKTRWGQTLQGRFPRYQGEIAALPDSRHQVRLRLSTRDVEIVGNNNYTRLTRGRGFFDAERYPLMEFVSDPYPVELVRDGGALTGMLTLRGVQRRETFTIARSACARPGLDCDVVATGSVSRGNYGVDRWAFALSDRVRFSLQLRTREGGK